MTGAIVSGLVGGVFGWMVGSARGGWKGMGSVHPFGAMIILGLMWLLFSFLAIFLGAIALRTYFRFLRKRLMNLQQTVKSETRCMGLRGSICNF